ncbi:MAG: DUF4198 domain-containing protein [Planctomycetes bacterium]|nr:DUF4198 domain-containing protein [Planctomycetota bacterium]
MMMLPRRTLAVVLVLATAITLAAISRRAHDTWLLTVPGDDGRRPARLSVRTGMDFPISENAVAIANLSGLLVAPDGKRHALADFSENPADHSTGCPLGALADGLHVAIVDTQPKRIELDARKFNDYLLHDGLPHVLAARMDAGEEDRAAKEQYRKCAKVVFAVGGAHTGPYDAVVGQKLEIVPLDCPTTLPLRSTLRVRVLFDGAPLVRANLCWDLPGNGEDLAGCSWTDAAGEALVPIGRAGWMTVRLVHMTRPGGPQFEWESFWASCSFEVPARP